MEDRQHNQPDSDWQRGDHDELNAALARYTAVEPRAGLEERILTNLRDQRRRAAERAWWPWGLAAAFVAIIVVTLALGWRSEKSTRPTIVNHPSGSPQTSRAAGTLAENNTIPQTGLTPIHRTEAPPSPPRPASGRPGRPVRGADEASAAPVATAPKLDQFPSPRPLSEQEKILESYVNTYPTDAALIAEARMESLRQDREQELREAPADNQQDSQYQ